MVVAIKRLKDPPTWLKVATTLEKPPNPHPCTHYQWFHMERASIKCAHLMMPVYHHKKCTPAIQSHFIHNAYSAISWKQSHDAFGISWLPRGRTKVTFLLINKGFIGWHSSAHTLRIEPSVMRKLESWWYRGPLLLIWSNFNPSMGD